MTFWPAMFSLMTSASEAGAESGGWIQVATVWSVVALLIAINGLFVAAEIALVGVRPTHLRHLADRGASP